MPRLLVGLLSAGVIFGAVIAQELPTIARQQTQAPGGQRTFEGTWSVTGQQTVLPTEKSPASISQLSGAVALEASDGLTRAFRGQVISYDDGSGTVSGRAVWTDHN